MRETIRLRRINAQSTQIKTVDLGYSYSSEFYLLFSFKYFSKISTTTTTTTTTKTKADDNASPTIDLSGEWLSHSIVPMVKANVEEEPLAYPLYVK